MEKMPWHLITFCLALSVLLGSATADARSHSYGYHPRAYTYHPRSHCYGCSHRSSGAKSAFKHLRPCPSTGRASGPCPGYVIDHINPLKRGGADARSNMQWQSREAAKLKDKWE